MTPCEDHQAAMVALFDNEARDEDLRLAANHLRDCPGCRAFCRELIGIRRTLVSAAVPNLSSSTRQTVIDRVRGNRHEATAMDIGGSVGHASLTRWAAILVIGLLSIVSMALHRTAQDLRTRLRAAEQKLTAVREHEERIESEERQQKAISALYFRMAELEERVNRSSRPERASLPAPVYNRSESDNNL